jgi:hypothetical protein
LVLALDHIDVSVAVPAFPLCWLLLPTTLFLILEEGVARKWFISI